MMNKFKKYLPFFLISLVIIAVVAVYCFNTFISESKRQTDEKVDTIFSYIRETLNDRSEAILKQSENHQSKMSGSIRAMSDALWMQYGSELLNLKGNELAISFGDAIENLEGTPVILVMTDQEGHILQWAGEAKGTMKLKTGMPIQSVFEEGESKLLLSSADNAEDETSPVTCTPVQLKVSGDSPEAEARTCTVYTCPIGESRLVLMMLEDESFLSSENYALQNASFISNLDEGIIFLDIDPSNGIITNASLFDAVFTVTETDEDGKTVSYLEERDSGKLGITKQMLTDGYQGSLRLLETDYSTRTMIYRNKIYPEGKTVLAMIPNGFTSDISYAFWLAGLFLLVMIIFLLYILFLKGRAIMGIKPEEFKPIFHGKLYCRNSFWKKLTSAGIITLCMILLISAATITLGEISRGMQHIRSRHESISKELSDNYLHQQVSDEAETQTYLLLTETAVFSIQSDPERILSTEEQPTPFFLTDENGLRIPYTDYTGREISCRLNCTELKNLAEQLGFQSATLYNVDGYPLAGSQKTLPGRIGKEDPLYPVLSREKDFVFSQYNGSRNSTAITFDLYRQTDELEEEHLLSKAEYVELQAQEAEGLSSQIVTLVLKEKESHTAARSGIQMAASLLEEDNISGNSYLLYADDENRSPLFIPSILNGIAADAIAVPKEALENEYYGFVNLGGTRYLLYSRRMSIEDSSTGEGTSYWLVALQEKENVFRYRPTALRILGIVTFVLLLGLVLTQSFCTESSMKKLIEEEKGAEKFMQKLFAEGKIPEKAIRRFLPDGKSKGFFDEKTGMKISSIIYWSFVLFVVIFLLFFLIYWRKSETVSVMQWIGKGLWTPGVSVYSITSVFFLLSCAVMLSNLFKKLTNFVTNISSSRVETLIKLFFSIMRYATALFVIFYSLYLLGMNTGSVLASLGLVSMVIGLGANKLIGDIVAGIFIIMEGEFRVGDIVTVQGFSGRVTEIGVRTTKIENADGNVSIYTNSSIVNILNMSVKKSKVKLDLKFRKDIPVEKIEDMLQKNLPVVSEKCPFIHENMKYVGIDQIGGIGNVFRVEATCSEFQRAAFSRYLNRELLRICLENDISIC